MYKLKQKNLGIIRKNGWRETRTNVDSLRQTESLIINSKNRVARDWEMSFSRPGPIQVFREDARNIKAIVLGSQNRLVRNNSSKNSNKCGGGGGG